MSEKKVPEEIEKLVKKLTSLTDESQIVEKLQEILEVLLTTTELRFTKDKTTVIVKPLEIEAYYYNEGVFEDECVHNHLLQRNRQGQIYLHRRMRKEDFKMSKFLYPYQRVGMDLVLSDSDDYTLAILIKCAEIDSEKIAGQSKVVKKVLEKLGLDYNDLRDEVEKQDKTKELSCVETQSVLVKCEDNGKIKKFSKRKNVSGNKKNLPLRATFRRNSPEN